MNFNENHQNDSDEQVFNSKEDWGINYVYIDRMLFILNATPYFTYIF